jgi:hypothetical protein
VGSDRESVKAGAVAALHAALIDGEGVAEALRGCWYRNPLFASTLLSESVRLRFARDCDVRLITGFVARIRSSQGAVPLGFPSREAEALIRACLGEVALLEEVDPSLFSYPELGIAISGRLFGEWEPNGAEVRSLFQQVDAALPAMHDFFPELGPGEEDWFAAGMHESPFAVPMGEGPPQRVEEG